MPPRQPPPPPPLPDKIWEHIFTFLPTTPSPSLPLVSPLFRRLHSQTLTTLSIPNSYSVSPSALARFPNLKSLYVKGKPHFADFNLVPDEWGGGAYEWVKAVADGCKGLEELRMKRMVVTDECLEILAGNLKGFRVLRLVACEGFSTLGLASLAANCSNLEVLDIQVNDADVRGSHWLGRFPTTFNSLTSLNLGCLEGELNIADLEKLVSQCPNLRTLKLNNAVPLGSLATLMNKAPQLVELGTGKFTADSNEELYAMLVSSFSGCKDLKILSGFVEASPYYLPVVYSVCDGLTYLNLSHSNIQHLELVELVGRCKKLRKLWVLDHIEDSGLDVVASSCKLLQELRVFPSHPFDGEPPVSVTERGLVAVSSGCPMLNSILYFCRQMTNAALVTVARSSPNLTRFRLCIIDPYTPDYTTSQPMDEGFSAIVESCKGLRRLSLSGLLTDCVFQAIGANADCLEMLSVAFAGDSDASLHYVLSGCKSLRKLEIRDCPFGDKALLDNASKLETMQSLWMSSCRVSLGACKSLAKKVPGLNVEVINENMEGPNELWPDDGFVEKLYVYRTVAGPRHDAPDFVWTV